MDFILPTTRQVTLTRMGINVRRTIIPRISGLSPELKTSVICGIVCGSRGYRDVGMNDEDRRRLKGNGGGIEPLAAPINEARLPHLPRRFPHNENPAKPAVAEW